MADPVAAWGGALASWAIPPELLSAAVDDPWSAGEAPYRDRAEAAAALAELPDAGGDPSRSAALEALAALPGGRGSVLDVGAGAGAAGFAVSARATRLTAVEPNGALLGALRARATEMGLPLETLQGRWPEISAEVDLHDIALSHHVCYDVPAIGPFLRALTDRARHRVVLEVSAQHPLSWVNPLWLRFHGIRRPERPTADDLVAVLRALGFAPSVSRWERPLGGSSLEAAVDRARRNLCLPREREREVAAAMEELIAAGELRGGPVGTLRQVATIWWDPSA